MQQPRSPRSIALCLVALIALTALDLWTKHWAQTSLSSERAQALSAVCAPDAEGHFYMQRARTETIVLVPNYLELRYAENCGAAFGMLDEAPRALRVLVFMGSGLVAIAALMWMFVRGHGGPLFALSVPFIASGAFGNMVDRLRLGYVVDFIRFYIYDSFEWPTFNVADAAITVGVAFLLLDGLRRTATTAAAAETEQAGTGSA